MKDAGPAGARTATELLLFKKAVSVTGGTDSGPQDAVIFKTPGRRRSLDICDEAAGTQCRGFTPQRDTALGRFYI